MNVYLITYPDEVPDESLIINRLFEAGLETLHVRKPGYSISETATLLKSIDQKYHSRISLHQHHELSRDFQISRFHFSEEKRKLLQTSELPTNEKIKKIYSTSIHKITDYKTLPASFDYCFFGPVFNSISKQNYPSAIPVDFRINENPKTKIIAIGGIDENNIEEVKKMGFSGAALLGAIWLSKDPIEKFKNIQHLCQQNQFVY